MVDEDLNGQFVGKSGSGGKFLSLLKSFVTLISLLLVVAASFWISFQLGKRILIPVTKVPEGRIEAVIPEPPAAIQALQEPSVSVGAVEESVPVVQEEKIKAAVPVKVKEVKKPVAGAIEAVRRYFKVQAGLYVDRDSAKVLADQVKENGFDVFVKKVSEGWRVQAGAFNTKAEAENLQKALLDKGLKSQIVYE